MGVASKTVIQNSALIKLGAERIVSDDDSNNRARVIKERYPVVLQEVLRSHPWRFATSYVELAAVSPTPTDLFEYDYAFQLPSDCLRVIGTNLCSSDAWEEIEGLRIACNVSELKVKFIKYVTDTSKYDANFCELVAWALAADVAYAITQSTAQAESMKAGYENKLKTARSFSAQVGSVKQVEASEWVNSRRY